MILNGTTYPDDLPKRACTILERYRTSPGIFRGRLLIRYDCGYMQSGYITRTTGRVKAAATRSRVNSLGCDPLSKDIIWIGHANKRDGGVLWMRTYRGLREKPDVGDILVYHDGTKHRVTGFHPTQPGICRIESVENPDPPDILDEDRNCFIWRFGDGELNSLFTLAAKQEKGR